MVILNYKNFFIPAFYPVWRYLFLLGLTVGLLVNFGCIKSHFIRVEGWSRQTFPHCSLFEPGNYRIDSKAALDSIGESHISQNICSYWPVNGIDFEKNTMLGISILYMGCDFLASPELLVDPGNDEYIFSVKITPQGDCTDNHFATVFISTSKIPAHYSVRYEVQK